MEKARLERMHPIRLWMGPPGGSGDNNNDKAIGARWHCRLGRRLILGVSAYRDVYTNKSVEKKLGISMLGLDIQLRPTATTQIRMGYTTAIVSLDETKSSRASYMRAACVELGQRFGVDDRWKFLVRAGSSQNDNRVVDISDKTIIKTTPPKELRFGGSAD